MSKTRCLQLTQEQLTINVESVSKSNDSAWPLNVCMSVCLTTNHPPPLADGEHELTSEDGCTLSHSVSQTESAQSTPAKEGTR